MQEPSAWELGLWLAVGALDTSRNHPKVKLLHLTSSLFPAQVRHGMLRISMPQLLSLAWLLFFFTGPHFAALHQIIY